METWATVVIVFVSNAIIGTVSVLTIKKQIKHSREQFKMQLEAQKEADKHERQREIRSEPLLKLRSELSRMAAKGERVASLVIPFPFGSQNKEESEEFRVALNDWNNYMTSGEFEQVLFMQYDLMLVDKVNAIRLEYDGARHLFGKFWQWYTDAGKEHEYDAAIHVLVESRRKVAEVQSEVNKLLEEL
jgi:hypothetical protein